MCVNMLYIGMSWIPVPKSPNCACGAAVSFGCRRNRRRAISTKSSRAAAQAASRTLQRIGVHGIVTLSRALIARPPVLKPSINISPPPYTGEKVPHVCTMVHRPCTARALAAATAVLPRRSNALHLSALEQYNAAQARAGAVPATSLAHGAHHLTGGADGDPMACTSQSSPAAGEGSGSGQAGIQLLVYVAAEAHIAWCRVHVVRYAGAVERGGYGGHVEACGPGLQHARLAEPRGRAGQAPCCGRARGGQFSITATSGARPALSLDIVSRNERRPPKRHVEARTRGAATSAESISRCPAPANVVSSDGAIFTDHSQSRSTSQVSLS